jgi:DNA-binding transcriptional MocR family regulator
MQRQVSAVRTAALLGRSAGRSPAYRGIADGLRSLISDGRIPPGTRLPSERELTAALGVSRTTVTRAYDLLKERGYVSSRQGSGSVTQLPVSAPPGDVLLDPAPGEPNRINLSCAAPISPPGVMEAYEAALAELPEHLHGAGYFPSGLPALREAIARTYDERGLPTDPEQVLVTSGALSALAVAVRAFVGSGDRVLMESPSYPNAIASLRGSGARVIGADIDQTGWATSSLVDTVRQARPRAAYLMPDFHNPTGQLMNDEQRTALAGALRAARTLPIVDETMVDLAIDEQAMPAPFAAHLADTVSLGSASKSYWGGLRIGWIRVARSRMGPLMTARLSIDLGAPLVEQLALVHLMAQRESMLDIRRRQLAESRSALVAALAVRLPSWRFRLPAGGLSLWCELPRPVSSAMTAAAERHGVRIAAGPLFAPEGGLERYVRLPFTQSPETLVQAVELLGDAWDEGVRSGTRRRSGAQDPALVT